MSKHNDISILISGKQESGRALAAVLINKALTDSGFSDVRMVSDKGEPIPPINVVPSILDIMKQGAPDLFSTRVVIQEVKTRAPFPKTLERRKGPEPAESDIILESCEEP